MRNTASLYIDESGKSSLAQKENEPFLITGVILKDNETQAVEGFFNYIKRKYKIPVDKPFHSYDIYENPRTKISESDALALSGTLAEYISLIPIKTTIVVIDKQEFKNVLGIQSNEDFKGHSKRKEMKDFPYRVMASYLFGWFGKDLETENCIGQIFSDSRRGGDHQLLKTLHLCKEKVISFNKGYYEAVRNKVTAICFAEKGYLSGGLEITDLISYVTFFRARRLISTKQNIGLDLIWNEIKQRSTFKKIDEQIVRKFFGIKKGEVHKYLKID